MVETSSPKAGLWPAIAAVSGLLALLNGLDTALSSLPFMLDPAFGDEVPATYAIYLLVILVFPLSLVVFVAALAKKSGIALYVSIAIVFTSLLWRIIHGSFFFETVIDFLPFVALFSEVAYTDVALFIFSAYSALDLLLAGVLLTLAVLQHRRLKPSEAEAPLGRGATGGARTIFCRTCGTPGFANHFCQGCGSKLEA